MKLILTGGGDSDHFLEIDQFFINELPQGARLLFIPLAGDRKDWENGLDRIAETFATIDFGHIEMCLDLHQLSWKFLRSFHAIYIDGGNTFRLMNHMRKTHFYELIHRFLYHGGMVNGDSAGAIILGSHLETAHFGEFGDENESGIISYQGMNLLGNLAIHCHYEDQEDPEIEGFVSEYGFPVLALHENTAVACIRDEIRVIGENKAVLFLNKNSYKGVRSSDRSKIDIFPGERVIYRGNFLFNS